jgi:preprotein translocase SecE subunit
MRAKSTLVGFFFIASAMVVAFVLSQAFASLLAVLKVTDSAILGDRVTLSVLLGVVIAAAAAGGTFVWPKTKNYISAVADELNKVNWPSWAETKVNTLVVIATSIIAAMILGVFDITFGLMSDWLARNV